MQRRTFPSYFAATRRGKNYDYANISSGGTNFNIRAMAFSSCVHAFTSYETKRTHRTSQPQLTNKNHYAYNSCGGTVFFLTAPHDIRTSQCHRPHRQPPRVSTNPHNNPQSHDAILILLPMRRSIQPLRKHKECAPGMNTQLSMHYVQRWPHV